MDIKELKQICEQVRKTEPNIEMIHMLCRNPDCPWRGVSYLIPHIITKRDGLQPFDDLDVCVQCEKKLDARNIRDRWAIAFENGSWVDWPLEELKAARLPDDVIARAMSWQAEIAKGRNSETGTD